MSKSNVKTNQISGGFAELNQRYEDKTAVVRCECIFSTECVGGQPADQEGLKAFVMHHLGLKDPKEIEEAVARIGSEELTDVTPPEGEIKEEKVYGVRSLRRDEFGVWLGDWMAKSMLKVSMSRLGVFQEKRGSKGDVAEVGRVQACKYSLKNHDKPNQIYVVSADDDEKGCNAYYRDFMGRVQTPQGPVSIIHKSECIAPGSRFAFEFRFLQNFLDEDDVRDTLAFIMTVGLGSARSLERGKFRIVSWEAELGEVKKKGGKKAKDKPAEDEPENEDAMTKAERKEAMAEMQSGGRKSHGA